MTIWASLDKDSRRWGPKAQCNLSSRLDPAGLTRSHALMFLVQYLLDLGLILCLNVPARVVSMSGSPAPLTTIFTPPAGCFETTATPDVWQTCYETRATTECYWSRPDECYPTLASAYKTNFPPTSTAENVVFRYSRSPGVLPSGYSTVTTFRDILNNPNLVLGCLSYVSNYTPKEEHL